MKPVRQTQFVATHPKSRGDCMAACLASILEYPLHMVIDTCSDECRADWHGSIARWLADRGLNKVTTSPADERALHGVYSIGVGLSPRGPFNHAVVCKSGRMVFDPHPSDDGCGPFIYHERLVEMTEAEQLLHARGAWFAKRREGAVARPASHDCDCSDGVTCKNPYCVRLLKRAA